MLRKLWKTIKFFLILGIVLLCLPHSILPKQSSGIKKSDLENYIRLNNNEQRLLQYKDDDNALKIKLGQLEIINDSRKKYNAEPVKLDILASRVANKICTEAASGNFIGHYNLEGENPYQRYAFAGGHDHVSENAFGEWTSGSYTNSESLIISMMKKGHSTFMSEKPPYDGHKKNILNKSHNYAGIGYFLSGNQFRYYEEFIDRAFEFGEIPSEVSAGQAFNINLSITGKNYLYYLIVYHDNFPKPMTAKQISSRGSYNDFTGEMYLRMPAWDLARFRHGDEYTIPLKFNEKGLYYIQIYTDRKEITSPGTVNTAGKTPYSGIVVKVLH